MPKLTVDVDHALGRDEAARRLKHEIERSNARGELPVTDVTQQWQDYILSFAFQAMGIKVTGTLTVEDNRVVVDAELPLSAMVLKAMIQQQIRHELGQVLA
ncbi:MAG: polyhydroxyalkanoic acid system family protein [Thermoguttaceae bacterium]